MTAFLGIDGGGTKTLAVILDEEGRELGRGVGGPCNVATCSIDVLHASMGGAVAAARSHANLPASAVFSAVCAGVAGYTSPSGRASCRALLTELAPSPLHVIEPDYVGAFWGAGNGEPGVVVIAGTGAVAFGRNRDGGTWRIDGRGYLLGDRGSAFDIARSALRCLAWRADHGVELIPFDLRLLRQIGASSVDEMVEWLYRDFRPARVAELTRAIGAWATEGDEVAVRWFERAAHQLRSLVVTVIRRLELPADAPVFCLGGLWQVGEVLREPFRLGPPRVRNLAAPLNVCEPARDAACGAALLAAAVARGYAMPVHPQEDAQ